MLYTQRLSHILNVDVNKSTLIVKFWFAEMAFFAEKLGKFIKNWAYSGNAINKERYFDILFNLAFSAI